MTSIYPGELSGVLTGKWFAAAAPPLDASAWQGAFPASENRQLSLPEEFLRYLFLF